MPRYLVERTLEDDPELGTTAGTWPLGARPEITRANSRAEATWLHSYVSTDRRRMFCLYEAPSPEAVRHAAVLNRLPVDTITEVLVLDPFPFR
jgi:hypothetical protein